jgi:predicted dehydrogenase
MDIQKTRVGVVGCGAISGIYLTAPQRNPILEMAACADLDVDRARAKAAEHGVPKACTVAELLADPAIEIVLNLTVPKAHAEIALAALRAGKHVYNEKPLAVTRADARKMLALAARKGLRVGGAPDTFFGAGHQACRKAVDEGLIGTPVAATAFMLCPGHERWHPSPEFYYQKGGGPMFDMGPYYITALIHLLGPVKRVVGMSRITHAERTIGSEPKHGQKIPVETPTHIVGVLEFASGPLATVVMSFDVHGGEVPRIEVYGSQGTLSCPDPNCFRGPARVRLAGQKEFSELPLPTAYVENSRGVGVADLATALRSGRAHRASAELTYHVLDVMQAVAEASEKGRRLDIASTCERPAPLPTGLEGGRLDP